MHLTPLSLAAHPLLSPPPPPPPSLFPSAPSSVPHSLPLHPRPPFLAFIFTFSPSLLKYTFSLIDTFLLSHFSLANNYFLKVSRLPFPSRVSILGTTRTAHPAVPIGHCTISLCQRLTSIKCCRASGELAVTTWTHTAQYHSTQYE